MPPQLAFLPEDGVPPADTLRLAGLLTRERVAVFSPGSSAVAGHVERAFFYDAAGSLIQTAELSPDGHVSRSSAARDLAGNVLVSVERHGSDVLRSSFSYDARGRLLSETHSLVSPRDSAATVITHSYDRLGRRVSSSFSDRVARRRPGFPLGVSGGLISPDLSSALPAPAGLGAVSVRDAFDIRGDLVSRAAVSEYAAGVQLPVARTLFVSGLRRQRPELQGSEPRFGGKISEWTYSGANKATARTWSLASDPFGRLASAVLLRDDGSPAGASETLAFGPDANLLSATRSTDGDGADSLALSYDGVLLSSAGGRPAEHDASGALSLHPLSGARVIRNPLGGLSALERDGSARILASCDADGRLISLSDSAGTSGLVRRGSFSYALVDGREALAGVPFPGGRFVRDERGSTGVIHFVTDHLGSPRAVVRGGDVAARLDLLPSGVTLSASGLDDLPGDADRLRFAGKEDLSGPSLGLLPLLDFGARLYDPRTIAWDSPDPLADKYPSLSPYAYCAGDPVNFIDPDGKRIIIGSAFRRFMSKLGVNNYEAKVQSQIEELKNIHPEINDMISFIEDSPITIKVVHPTTYHDSQGNHFVFNAFYRSDKTIMYDPENDILPSGKTRPAIIGLAHEFAHVENFLKGTEVQVNRDKARHGDKNEIEKLNEDELHSIQIENLVREVYNIPLRNETYYELPEE